MVFFLFCVSCALIAVALIAVVSSHRKNQIGRLLRRVNSLYSTVEWLRNIGSLSFDRDTRTREDLYQTQIQFNTLVESLGLKFIPEKTEEVHQGDNHTVKVTPATFAKSRSR